MAGIGLDAAHRLSVGCAGLSQQAYAQPCMTPPCAKIRGACSLPSRSRANGPTAHKYAPAQRTTFGVCGRVHYHRHVCGHDPPVGTTMFDRPPGPDWPRG